MRGVGKVTLIGAGPGDPDLLTVKALRAFDGAEIVVHDRLVSDAVMALIPPHVERLCVGKSPDCHPIPQHEINRRLVDLARSGRKVVRLKGGDPFIFGRGSEEAAALVAAGIPYEIVPGITAAQGAAASAGVPLTHRGVATSVRYVTGHCKENDPLDLDWSGLADPRTTLVVYMGHSAVAEIERQLIGHGLPGDTPVLAVANATHANERRLRASLDGLAGKVAAARFDGPVLFIVGNVVGLSEDLRLGKVIDIALSDGERVDA